MAEDNPTMTLEEVAIDQSHYAIHLSEVNKTQNVTATEDIFAENGLLIAPKGTNIDHATAERILRLRLFQPLESLVRLEQAMTAENLDNEFRGTLDSYPDARELHTTCIFQENLKWLVHSNPVNPMLMQELTVMRERLPSFFRKTLLCTWLSVMIASELGMKDNAVTDIYLAGLSHDIGFLHIPPDIFQQTPLSATQWRAIQSHVIIGYFLLKRLYGADSAAARAVLEHHERCDGSGYPVGKTEGQLDTAGQTIGIADSLQAIRMDKFAASGRNLKGLVPVLHMNSGKYSPAVCEAAYSILTRSGPSQSSVNPCSDAGTLVENLISRGNRLQKAVAILHTLDTSRMTAAGNEYKKISSIIDSVKPNIARSGLVANEVIEWLEGVQGEAQDAPLDELTEMDTLQTELHWQLKRICRVIDQSLDAHDHASPCMSELAMASKKITESITGL